MLGPQAYHPFHQISIYQIIRADIGKGLLVDSHSRLNYVPNKPQPAKIDVALSNSFGFGGTNGSLVFRRWAE